MVRRYDLTRSDNAPFTGKKAYSTNGSTEGYIFINIGFKISHAIISWSSIYTSVIAIGEGTSEESTGSTSSTSSTSSSSLSSISSSSDPSSISQSYSSYSSSSSSEEWQGPFDYPRIYVYSYQDSGFTVRYENIPVNAKYIEFEFSAL